jgi:ribonuclease HI
VDQRDAAGQGTTPKIGAAYYDDTIPEDDPVDDVTYIEPTARGMNNTITRAELVAIYAVLHNLQDRRELQILTDSAAAIQLILQTLKRPMEVRDHLHKAVLFTITDLIAKRDEENKTTFLGKVRSHIGVKGNEIADKAANYMAKNWAPSKPYITVVTIAHFYFGNLVVTCFYCRIEHQNTK